MKQILTAVAIIFAAAAFPALALAEERVVVTVKGMVCSFCAQGLKKTFKKKAEVIDIDVDLDAKLVTIRFQDGKVLPDAEVEEMIKDAGYDVQSIEHGGQNG